MFNSLSRSLIAASAVLPLSLGAALAAGSHAGGHHGASADIGEPGDPAAVDRVIEVSMTEMAYDPSQLQVEEGETIRFIVANDGELVHEFNIGTAEMHKDHIDEMSAMVETGIIDGDNIDRSKMKQSGMVHDDPSSVLLEPGQTADVVWTFSGDAKIEFACSVPGHRQSGMIGKITKSGAGS